MAYFDHAFKKTFFMYNFARSGSTENLFYGDVGFFDAKSWNAIPSEEASMAAHPQLVLAAGTQLTADKRGTHGGYMESIKSQVIEPRNVHRFWKVRGRSAQGHIVQLGWDSSDAATAPTFYCGATYHLRIDVKGSPALRLFDHHVYRTFVVRTKCCVNTDTPEKVDPVSVLLGFAEQINKDPIVSKFINATVVDGSGTINPDTYTVLTDSGDIAATTAGLRLTVGYTDTTFTYCSFDPRDYYELEPLVISSAQLMDETGDPCSNFKKLTFTEIQAAQVSDGRSDTIIRELLLLNDYRQDHFEIDTRRKDAFGQFGLFNLIGPGTICDSYYILHSAPRKYNPSGVYDHDQYLLRICTPEDYGGGVILSFEEWFVAYLDSANSNVQLEDLSLTGA
jgi:hypothetical protein